MTVRNGKLKLVIALATALYTLLIGIGTWEIQARMAADAAEEEYHQKVAVELATFRAQYQEIIRSLARIEKALEAQTAAFRYTRGEPKNARSGIPNAVMREFCGECGTHLLGITPPLPDVVLIQPGTLDDPSAFGFPDIAVYTREKQGFHHVPDGILSFETIPSQ